MKSQYLFYLLAGCALPVFANDMDEACQLYAVVLENQQSQLHTIESETGNTYVHSLTVPVKILETKSMSGRKNGCVSYRNRTMKIDIDNAKSYPVLEKGWHIRVNYAKTYEGGRLPNKTFNIIRVENKD